MDDALFVQVVDGDAGLEEVDEGLLLLDFALLAQVEEQRAALRVLEYQVHL